MIMHILKNKTIQKYRLDLLPRVYKTIGFGIENRRNFDVLWYPKNFEYNTFLKNIISENEIYRGYLDMSIPLRSYYYDIIYDNIFIYKATPWISIEYFSTSPLINSEVCTYLPLVDANLSGYKGTLISGIDETILSKLKNIPIEEKDKIFKPLIHNGRLIKWDYSRSFEENIYDSKIR